MKYEQLSILKVMEMIGKNEMYLPAIQRKFVWDTSQITRLFDSIIRGYPIGTFLFWSLEKEDANKFALYKFIQEYHERDRVVNEIAPKPEMKDRILAVLDGQQRLSSLYIALQGSYGIRAKYRRHNDDNAYPRRRLYLNILQDPDNQKEDSPEEALYQFEFLTDAEKDVIGENEFWFPVKTVLDWGDMPQVDEYYDGVLEDAKLDESVRKKLKERRSHIKGVLLRELHRKLVDLPLINYFSLNDPDLNKILDVFVRVNSAGTPLSKSDLLFSMIVSQWEDGRSEIENLLESINKRGERFRFDTDFVMRVCLVLADGPVRFRSESFSEKSVRRVTKRWPRIRSAIEETVDLLTGFGINGDNLTSANAVIPITYYIFKNGIVNDLTKHQMKLYLVSALLKKTFGGHGDQVLSKIREALRRRQDDKEDSDGFAVYELASEKFSFSTLVEASLPGEKSLMFVEEDIDDILEMDKGALTFVTLSLVYPHLQYGQKSFHQDHIHPRSTLTKHQLKKAEVPNESIEDWVHKRDQLPNLQLLEGRANESKGCTSFEEWITGTDGNGNKNVPNSQNYCKDNYIPTEVDWGLRDFDKFFAARKALLKVKLTSILT